MLKLIFDSWWNKKFGFTQTDSMLFNIELDRAVEKDKISWQINFGSNDGLTDSRLGRVSSFTLK